VFDRIMENTMAIWLPVSAAYLVFMAGMIVKAIRHFRRQRNVPAYTPGPRRAYAASGGGTGAELRARDWTPAR
jgi:hypothetical protein